MSVNSLRKSITPYFYVYYVLFSVLLAFVLTSIFILVLGQNPLSAYWEILKTGFFSEYGLSETLVKTIPLAITGLAVGIALKVGLWNIGAEGQFYIGALFSTAFMLFHPLPSHFLNITIAMGLGILGGAFWALLPAVLRVKLELNEILTTLLLNYVGIYVVDYFVYGPWKGPDNFPFTKIFPENTFLPGLNFGRLHSGIFIALILCVLLYFFYKKTRVGFEMNIIGNSPKTAQYSGMPVKRYLFWALLISGAMAGLAGAVQLMGVEHRLHHQISSDYGFTAIIVVWLAKNKPLSVFVVAFLLAGFITGVEALQLSGMPQAVSFILRGFLLLLILGEDHIKRSLLQ